jgi:phosphatidyl-myo-inositol dimannoside synthase
MRILALLTDGFGGFGGIAKFNRDLLTALCADARVTSVVALPRIMPSPLDGRVPAKLDWRQRAAGGKLRYVCELLRLLAFTGKQVRPHLILCGHLNLLPLAALVARRWRVPLWQILHGIEAWQPSARRVSPRALGGIDRLVAVSQCTRDRFVAWSGLDAVPWFRLPNCVDLSAYGPGSKPAHLLDRYGLRDATVIMTLGRLSAAERYKGFDEVLEVMPRLLQQTPNLCYLVCGDGDDRPRLVEKARSLGLRVVDVSSLSASSPPLSAFQHFSVSASSPPSPPPLTSELRPLTSGPSVIFTGRIPEAEKADHYRLADAFVMIGRGEGFGIVYLEALACGIPVVASTADASREAVRDGQLGELANPDEPEDIVRAIAAALMRPRGVVPAGLDYFSSRSFGQRCSELLNELSGIPAVRPLEQVHA